MDINYVVPLVAAVIYVSLFLVIILNRTWEKQHKLLVWYLLAAMLWSFSTFLLRSNYLMEYKLLLFRVVLFVSMWWVVQLYYFAMLFLNQPSGWGLWFGYALLLVFGILAALGYVPTGVTFSNGRVTPDYGWWFILYFGQMATLAYLAVSSLLRRLKTVVEPKERNKIAYLVLAIGLLVAFGFSGVTPLADKFPISHLGGLLSACILTYAVMKHELVSINSVLRRVLGWTSLFILGAGTYLLLFFLLQLMVGLELKVVTLVLATLAAAAVAVFIYWLRPIFLGIVDQLFYRGTYPYRQALLSFDSKMGNIINLSELADKMLPAISRALRTQRAKLLFEDSGSGDFITQFTYPKVKGKSRDEPRFNLDNPIVAWLKKEAGPLDLKQIDTIPQFRGLWQTEREKIVNSNLELLCPIKSRGKLIGILALGKKQSGVLYSHEDVELVMSLASQAGIIIENARMFDSLKNQQFQVQHLLTQAVLAQEEERERISVDIHDSVAQWLVAASYRAQTCNQLLSGDGNSKARDELADIESTLNKSVKELRRVMIGLRPPALDELGLTHALRQSLEDLKSDGLVGKYSEVGTPFRLPSSVEIAVYRIVQETLTNIRKHASATKVNLRLQFQADRLLVEIRDNGKGFDLSQTLDSAIAVGHMGLLGMKQRAEMLGGEVKIRTGEGAGTTIILSLPVQPQMEEK